MPDRYADIYPQPGDSNIAVDGDTQFTGMNSKMSPEKLPPGVVAYSQNQRFTTLTGQTRLGMAKQTNGIILNSAPLIIPFTVGSSATITNTVTDGVYGAITFSDPNNSNLQSIVIPTGGKAYVLSASGTLGTVTYPANETIENGDTVDYFQYGDNIYLFRGDIGSSFAVSSVTSTSTTATVTLSVSSNFSTGMWVQMAGATQAPYNGNVQITVLSASSFTYTMSGATSSPATTTTTITCNRLKLPMKWNGVASGSFALCSYGVITQNFSYIAPSNFGIIQSNRAILEQSRNTIIISQVEQPESYDTINGEFVFGPGTADYLIGVCPYQDNYCAVFLRHSIWLIDGTALDVSAMSSQILTPTMGCVSKRTIQTCGANICFLSDMGVFQLVPGYELALRGNVLPLSADITPIINQINFYATQVPCAAYFNNRYYLAVPLNGATRNNALLIYNFINEAWESQDTFPNGFYCDFMTVMYDTAGVPTLYVLSKEGGVYAYEQNEMDDFAAAAQPATQYLIQGQLKTRRLIFGSNVLKKFNRAIVNYDMDASSAMSCEALIADPDDTRVMPTISAPPTGHLTRPMIINKRGWGIQLQFANTSSRATVKSYTVGAYLKDLKSVGTT